MSSYGLSVLSQLGDMAGDVARFALVAAVLVVAVFVAVCPRERRTR